MKSISQSLRAGAVLVLLFISMSCISQATTNSKPSSSPDSTPTTQQDIWTQLRQGKGYVILLRHAQTVPGTGDPPGFLLNDCSTQRNLSQSGREQAAQIGRAFRERKIPITQVLSSQYCRCLDTAKLLDLGTVQPAPMLNSIFEDRSTAAQQTQQVRQQILNHRNTLGVVIMVSHYANINELSGIRPRSGGAVVIRANEQGAIAVVDQIESF